MSKGGRRNSRQTRRGGKRRGSSKSRGLFARLYSPVSHTLMFGQNTTNRLANTAKGVARMGLSGADGLGKNLTGHLNATVHNVFSRNNRNKRQSRRQRR